MSDILSPRISIAYPEAVWRRAWDSYIADCGTNGDTFRSARDRLGTRKRPKLLQCVVEVIAEADHGGLFEFLD